MGTKNSKEINKQPNEIMEVIKLSDDVIKQIKDFNPRCLTKRQKLLIEKLILNEELRNRYKYYGLCEECKQPNSGYNWCQSCNAQRFQQNFKNWTSKNHDIDKLIQNAQLKAKNDHEVLEWIEYNRFGKVEYLTNSGFETVYKAISKDGPIKRWDSRYNQWERVILYNSYNTVVLKRLHNLVGILKEAKLHIKVYNTEQKPIVYCYGITKDPKTNNFMIVMYYMYGLCIKCNKPYIDYDTWSHQSCNAQCFQQNFKNWTSGNHDIDRFIQNAQLKAKDKYEVLEWIEYDRFEDVEYLAKNGFETVHKAIWKDGPIINLDFKHYQWKRNNEYQAVALKCLPSSVEILREVKSHIKVNNAKHIVNCYGITKDPETSNFMIVTYYSSGLCIECNNPYIDYDTWSHQSCNAQRFQQNFKNWTSGNYNIDKFIQNVQFKAKNKHEVLEWIEYDSLENVEYLAKGGFGTVYKAIWKDGPIERWYSKYNQWKRSGNGCNEVALKCLHNSQDITVEFLKEIELHLIMNNSQWVVTCYGITKDPRTNNFMMVMKYAINGSLRHHLNNSFNSMDWIRKLRTLHRIAVGLKNIHDNKLIHQDFHCGNVLNIEYDNVAIADLGLCQPVNVKPSQSGDKKIYGVLPYVAPEVLRGKVYTQASDIYAFGIIAYEVYTGLPPYHNMDHKECLAIRICQGLRPKSTYKIPQLILDIIKQCWDADPLKRPKAKELVDLFENLYHQTNNFNDTNSLFYKQSKEADEINMQLFSTATSTGILSYTTHPQAVYTSRLLDYKNLPVPKNADFNDDSLELEYSESTRVDFTNLNINLTMNAIK